MNSSRSRIHPAVWYIGPAVIILILLGVVPIIFEVYASLFSFNLGELWQDRVYVGLRHYVDILSGRDPEFYKSLFTTIMFTVSVTLVSFLLGLGAAILLNRPLKARSLIIASLIVPSTITPSVSGLIWKLMCNRQYGVINHLFQKLFGKTVNWLGPDIALFSVTLVSIWGATAFMALVLSAGMSSVPREPIEAAMIDGATGFQILTQITLPIMRRIVLVALILQQISALHVFGTIVVMTQGGPGSATNVLGLHIYRTAFITTWIDRGSALGVILAVIAFIFTMILIQAMRRTMAESSPS